MGVAQSEAGRGSVHRPESGSRSPTINRLGVAVGYTLSRNTMLSLKICFIFCDTSYYFCVISKKALTSQQENLTWGRSLHCNN